jgi:hypothetical protein
MSSDPNTVAPVFHGLIEPHAGLLRRPPEGQVLYKVMSVENLVASIERSYLHFNRVDSYKDFPGADNVDGEQLPGDLPGNTAAAFIKNPEFTGAHYYDQSRSRTYAFCAPMEDTDHIWSFGAGTPRGNIGLVLDFDKLRATLNRTLRADGVSIEWSGIRLRQIFDLNYGLVDYVDRATHRANLKRLPNPIIYTYLKDRALAEERELRISLSPLGIGKYVLEDGSELKFPAHLQLGFDFGAAFAEGTIRGITAGPRCDDDFLLTEMSRLRIRLFEPAQSSGEQNSAPGSHS